MEGAKGVQENPKSDPKVHEPEGVKKEEAEPAPSLNPQGKKRKLGHGDFRNTNYFKIRTIIRDLRPLFLQVIHAPDFRENKAASDIQKHMKTMIELSRELCYANYRPKPKNPSNEEPSGGATKEVKHQVENHLLQPHKGEVPTASVKTSGLELDEKIQGIQDFARKLQEGLQGTYVIGGSPVGWNFLVYLGSQPVYYGETKVSFRARQAAHVLKSVV